MFRNNRDVNKFFALVLKALRFKLYVVLFIEHQAAVKAGLQI